MALKRTFQVSGFSLVELLIAMAVGLIALSMAVSLYVVQQCFYRYQQGILQAQQNLRCALTIVEQQIRFAGYDPFGAGKFGITDVRRYDLFGTKPNLQGSPAIFFSADMDENGEEDARNHFQNGEHLSFRIREDRNLGRRYLSFDIGSGRQPLAENVYAMGLAYAIDADDNGRPDTWHGGGNVIWAVDTDNDNLLDTQLDANDDGKIDQYDDIDGDGRITPADGAGLIPPIATDRICAVRIWLLSVSSVPLKNRLDEGTYVVGDRVIYHPGDGYVRLVIENIVQCRNLPKPS